jgi:hypothetical protein
MELAHGTSFFDDLAEDPGLGCMFDGVMTHVHGAEKQAVLLAGDVFTSLPAGGDAYLLSHIIHDWAGYARFRAFRRSTRSRATRHTPARCSTW